MPKVPLWHHDAVKDILQWPPLFMPYQIHWSLAAYQGLCTCLWVSSDLTWDVTCPHSLPLTASFSFSWAITETCCHPLGVPSAFLLPGFLMTLQMSLTFLSVRTWSLLGVCSSCSLMSNLADSGLNPSWTYISCNHKAIISGLHALCTLRIPMYTSHGIILWWRVSLLDISIFAYSASGSSSFCPWVTGSTLDSDPS